MELVNVRIMSNILRNSLKVIFCVCAENGT